MTPAQGVGATALITGVTGQDGSYLSELLLEDGLRVHGVLAPDCRSAGVRPEVYTHCVDLTSAEAMGELVTAVRPDHVFHLAGISSVAQSWAEPVLTAEVNALSTVSLLDACLQAQEKLGTAISVVNASSAEIFANALDCPQSESTPLCPTTPYGASKALGHMMCQIYRSKGLAASNAVLYNHESPRRPDAFVTRKITKAVAAIAKGSDEQLVLGDLSVQRDWGWAPDYVDALYRMAVHGVGEDFIIATGVAHSIADFVTEAFAVVGVDDWQAHVRTDENLLRIGDRPAMVGDASKAARVLNWRPTMSFHGIVEAMVNADLREEQLT